MNSTGTNHLFLYVWRGKVMRMGTHFSSMEPAGTTYILSLRTFSDIAATPPYSMLFSLGKRSRSSPVNTYILVERGE